MNIDEFLQDNNMTPDKSSDIFVIKQGRYEGPYTKLLEMIEKRKLSISEISLSKIADDYIEYIKNLDDVNPLDMSQFVQIASTLMLIKAKSLLPTIEYTEEEREQVGGLEKKLELLKELKAGEENIKDIFAKSILFSRNKIERSKNSFEDDVEPVTYTKPKSLTKENIFSVAALTLAKMPNFERLKQVAVRQAIRIEKVIERIMEHISSGISSLKDFAMNFNSEKMKTNQGGEVIKMTQEEQAIFKKNIIVSFLAILELLKTGVIDAFEKDGDIEVTKRQVK